MNFNSENYYLIVSFGQGTRQHSSASVLLLPVWMKKLIGFSIVVVFLHCLGDFQLVD